MGVWEEGPVRSHPVAIGDFPPAFPSALLVLQGVACPFANGFPLPLRHRHEHMHHQTAGGRRGVDLVRHDIKA